MSAKLISTEVLLLEYKKERASALTPGSQEQEGQQSKYELSTELRGEIGVSLQVHWMDSEE